MNALEKETYPRIAASFIGREAFFPSHMHECFPRLLQQLELLWGSRKSIAFLSELVTSNRPNRAGFPSEIVHEIVYLLQLHEFCFPQTSRNLWDSFAHAAFVPPEMPEDKAGDECAADSGSDLAPGRRSPTLRRAAEPAAADDDAGRWDEIRDEGALRVALEVATAKPLKKPHRRIGDILIDAGVLAKDHLAACLIEQKQERRRSPHPIGQILLAHQLINEEMLTLALCTQARVPIVDTSTFPITRAAGTALAIEVCRSKQALPLVLTSRALVIAVADPFSYPDRTYLQFVSGVPVHLVGTRRKKLLGRLVSNTMALNVTEAVSEFRSLADKALASLGTTVQSAEDEVSESGISENDATVVGLVNRMFVSAIDAGASDIHLEAFPGRQLTRIRFRKDGQMREFSEYPYSYHSAVVSRIKIMATLDISERRRPQDGKISFLRPGGGRVDLRVATIPGVRSIEFVTIRVLSSGDPIPLDRIGMSAHAYDAFKQIMAQPYGLILVCGPTGSGKTTTLHSALRELNTSDRKIWTAEDPIEIVQPNICQVQVNPKTGFTFAAALRSFLRADPDVVMIGEMRDAETAKTAVEASMTGHLVLSTLHTNSSSETAARLLELGVDHYNLSDAILGILAQRLARKFCRKCAERIEFPKGELEELATEYLHASVAKTSSTAEHERLVSQWRREFGDKGILYTALPRGCEECNGTGFSGRIGLYEMLVATPQIRTLIRARATASDFAREAVGAGMRTLKQDGIEKVLRGLTDIAQVRSACV